MHPCRQEEEEVYRKGSQAVVCKGSHRDGKERAGDYSWEQGRKVTEVRDRDPDLCVSERCWCHDRACCGDSK